MSEVYFITGKRRCEFCEGQRWIQNPIWQQLFEELGTKATREEEQEWFLAHGIYDEYPGEELECCECEGTGMITWNEVLPVSPTELITRIQELESQVSQMEGTLRAFGQYII